MAEQYQNGSSRNSVCVCVGVVDRDPWETIMNTVGLQVP